MLIVTRIKLGAAYFARNFIPELMRRYVKAFISMLWPATIRAVSLISGLMINAAGWASLDFYLIFTTNTIFCSFLSFLPHITASRRTRYVPMIANRRFANNACRQLFGRF